jgi:hypothetical protein
MKRFKLTRNAFKGIWGFVAVVIFVIAILIVYIPFYLAAFIDVEVFEPNEDMERCKATKLRSKILDQVAKIVPKELM